MVMQYVSGVLRGVSRDFEYLRNAPHFYSVPWSQAPRLAGYIAAGATALVAGGVGGWATTLLSRLSRL